MTNAHTARSDLVEHLAKMLPLSRILSMLLMVGAR